MKKCLNCGYETEEDLNFCPECGQKLSEADDLFCHEELPRLGIKVVNIVKNSDSTVTSLCEFSYYGSVKMTALKWLNLLKNGIFQAKSFTTI